MFLGEDVGGAGGVFKTTAGLLEEFGPDRVVDTRYPSRPFSAQPWERP